MNTENKNETDSNLTDKVTEELKTPIDVTEDSDKQFRGMSILVNALQEERTLLESELQEKGKMIARLQTQIGSLQESHKNFDFAELVARHTWTEDDLEQMIQDYCDNNIDNNMPDVESEIEEWIEYNLDIETQVDDHLRYNCDYGERIQALETADNRQEIDAETSTSDFENRISELESLVTTLQEAFS